MSFQTKIAAFLDSPANKNGLYVIAVTITAMVFQYAKYHALNGLDFAGLAVGILKILEPDNTVTKVMLAKVISDAGKAIASPNPTTVLAALADGVDITEALKPQTPVEK